jgi:hypothetical protein
MTRVTITIPDNLHTQVLKLAKKDGGSVSYTVSKLVELGLILTNKSNQNKENSVSKMDEHCNKLIIQLNEILKDLAINNYGFSSEKIAQISQETISKYNELLEK